METSTTLAAPPATRTDWMAVAQQLRDTFAPRARAHDEQDTFVADNFADLKAQRVFSAAVPAELGGGDASYRELCELLRTLAHGCPSTALALAMHTHNVATLVWRYQNQQAPVAPLLRRIAAEQLVLVTSGGSDWLAGSGSAEKVEGGYKVTARKVFASGSPGGQLLMTSAILTDGEAGGPVLHFSVALDTPGVTRLDTWQTLGMRGTGSHDILLDGVFVPEAAIGVRRPTGEWHPLFHLISMLALPLIYSVYVGIAEAARDVALQEARRRRDDPNLPYLVGEMENELFTARAALTQMIDTAEWADPGRDTTNTVTMGRAVAGRATINTVTKALEVAGGRAFYRSCPLERLFRDVQAARYHPLQDKPQLRYAGRLALGLDING